MFPSSSILAMKIVLMSCGVISLAVAMKYTFIPLIIHHLPTVYYAILLMFKPPYLFLVLNGIIIIITVISRFAQSEIHLAFVEQPLEVVEKVAIPSEVWDVKMPVVVNGLDVSGNYEEVGGEQEAEKAEVEEVKEKPLLLTASAAQKQSIFSSEGRSKSTKVRVTNHKRDETLDSTWRMIIEGRRRQVLPLTRRMKNMDTFANLENTLNSAVSQNSLFRKSATFKDRTNFLHDPQVMNSANLRKEPSLGKEELNRRVEAFIKKFNDDMRLQRQESLQRYMEIVNRGAN